MVCPNCLKIKKKEKGKFLSLIYAPKPKFPKERKSSFKTVIFTAPYCVIQLGPKRAVSNNGDLWMMCQTRWNICELYQTSCIKYQKTREGDTRNLLKNNKFISFSNKLWLRINKLKVLNVNRSSLYSDLREDREI